MKILKNMSIHVLAVTALFFAACSSDNQQAEANDNHFELYSAEHQRDSLEVAFVKTLNEIDLSIDRVFSQRNQATANDRWNAALRKEEILKNIQLAGVMLKSSRERVAQLKSQLGKYKIKNSELSRLLDASGVKIQQYEQQLALLKEEAGNKDVQIADLNEKARKLQFESIMQKEFADKFENDLNTAYYTTGTHKQLKQSGVIVNKGGVLGLGSTEELSTQYPEQLFAKVDIRKTTSIPVNAKKAKLVTNHPESSYELKESGGMIASLEIKNPDEFWKISKHMVLEVK